jgi:hypothetical protein
LFCFKKTKHKLNKQQNHHHTTTTTGVDLISYTIFLQLKVFVQKDFVSITFSHAMGAWVELNKRILSCRRGRGT